MKTDDHDDYVYATPTADPRRTALDMPKVGRYAGGLTTDEVLFAAQRLGCKISIPPNLASRFAGKGVTVRVEGRRLRPPFPAVR